jgi:cytochrome c2
MLDTMTLTKVVGAFCGALLVYLLGGWMGEALYHGGHGTHEQAYVIDTGSDDGAEEVVEEVDMIELVAAADAGAGERVFRACGACHKIAEPVNGVGPHLDGVMGREIASIGDFSYSGALPAGEVWGIENMSAWIENPSGFAEGTSMNYRGLSDDEDRADLIAYLISMSPDYDMTQEEAAAGDAAPEDAAAETDTASADEAPQDEVGETETASADAATEEAPAEGDTTAAADTTEAGTGATDAQGTDMAMAADDDTAPAEDAASADATTDDAAAADDTATAEATTEEAAPVEEATADAAAQSPFVMAYQDADAAAGERVYRQCQACHVADREQNRVGPHLVNIVGRPIGSIDGFRYSGALPEGEWTLDNLNAWLENPRGFAQGTSMSYAGLRDMEDRANVIAYIESLN